MQHVMLDLETWGTRPGSALRSVGAVVFDFGDTFDRFYRNVDTKSCLDVGLVIEPETVGWWQRQSVEAIAHLEIDPRPITEVVCEFHEWFIAQDATHLWCHGAGFDEPLWAAVAHRLGLRVPWKYRNVRCTRTLYEVMNFHPRSMPREGVHHNALDDAVYQVQCVQAAMQSRYAPAQA